jgi:glycosyl transferase family 61
MVQRVRYTSGLEILRARVSPFLESTLSSASEEVEYRKVRAPDFHDDPDGAALFPALSEIEVPHSPLTTIHASSVRMTGYRYYFSNDDLFFSDQTLVNETETEKLLGRLAGPTPFEKEETGLTRLGGRTFGINLMGRPIIEIDDPVLSLCSFEPGNYGSFLFRVLPKLVSQETDGRKIIAPCYWQSMRHLLELTGIAPDAIIPQNTRAVYRLREASIPSVRNPHALLDNETLALYRGLREKFGTRSRSRKIYVSRLGWTLSTRFMLNENDLATRLAAIGFEILRPHEMTMNDQIEAFSSADLVVGPAGSAMFNAVFCHPGTALVDIESERNWMFAHQCLFSSCGLKFGVLEAKANSPSSGTPHKAFTANIDALLARISTM